MLQLGLCCTFRDAPLVYDVYHHGCNPDGLTVDEAAGAAAQT